jgi:anaerobic magnesium-protoporphyrin IX monomethyl ester cyclase
MTDVILAKLELRESELERYRYPAPFGILYLATALEEAGFSVRLYHGEGTRAHIEELTDLVVSESPLFVGFTTLTGPVLVPTVEASRAIRRKSRVPIVWGGPHPTIVPEQTLSNDFVDIIALSEGEETVVELARALRGSGLDPRGLSGILGIGYRDGGRAILTGPRPFIKNLDGLAPAWHHLDHEAYFYSEKMFRAPSAGPLKAATLMTSRGCPWRCAYCWNERVNRREFRAQSAGRAVQDVQELKEKHGVTAVLFEDDNFFTNPQRGLDIVRRIGIPWSSTFRASDIARGGPALMKELKNSRCLEVRVGAESGSQRILNAIHKDLTVEQIREAARLCRDYEITAAIMFMFGFPQETWEDVLQTLDLIDELNAMSPYIMVTQLGSYTPYPGTELYDEAIQHGFVPPRSTVEWGAFVEEGVRNYRPPYIPRKAQSLTYFQQLINRNDLGGLKFPLPVLLLQRLARWRWKHRFFSLPLDHTGPVFVRDLLEKAGLFSVTRSLYRK